MNREEAIEAVSGVLGDVLFSRKDAERILDAIGWHHANITKAEAIREFLDWLDTRWELHPAKLEAREYLDSIERKD